MRIFDALNDVDNMKSTIKYVKESGGMADCAISFTVDPSSAHARGEVMDPSQGLTAYIFTIDYFMEKARQLEALGADMISIKDMAGLISSGTIR